MPVSCCWLMKAEPIPERSELSDDGDFGPLKSRSHSHRGDEADGASHGKAASTRPSSAGPNPPTWERQVEATTSLVG